MLDVSAWGGNFLVITLVRLFAMHFWTRPGWRASVPAVEIKKDHGCGRRDETKAYCFRIDSLLGWVLLRLVYGTHRHCVLLGE